MLIALIAIIILSAGADQLTKHLIFGHDSAFIPGVIRFRSVENRGMVWGVGNGVNGFTVAISIVTAVVIAILIYLLIKHRRIMPKLAAIALAFITGGAIGNLIDRIALGFVRDFLCTEFIDFPVFNVADVFVTCGAILLGIILIFTRKGRAFVSKLFPEDGKKKSGAGVE